MVKAWCVAWVNPDGEYEVHIGTVDGTRASAISRHDAIWDLGYAPHMAYRLRRRRGEVLAVKVRIVEGWE